MNSIDNLPNIEPNTVRQLRSTMLRIGCLHSNYQFIFAMSVEESYTKSKQMSCYGLKSQNLNVISGRHRKPHRYKLSAEIYV